MEIGSNAEYRAAGVGVDLLRAGPREFNAELSIASGSIGLDDGLEVADGSLALVLADAVVKIGAAVLRAERFSGGRRGVECVASFRGLVGGPLGFRRRVDVDIAGRGCFG